MLSAFEGRRRRQLDALHKLGEARAEEDRRRGQSRRRGARDQAAVRHRTLHARYRWRRWRDVYRRAQEWALTEATTKARLLMQGAACIARWAADARRWSAEGAVRRRYRLSRLGEGWVEWHSVAQWLAACVAAATHMIGRGDDWWRRRSLLLLLATWQLRCAGKLEAELQSESLRSARVCAPCARLCALSPPTPSESRPPPGVQTSLAISRAEPCALPDPAPPS